MNTASAMISAAPLPKTLPGTRLPKTRPLLAAALALLAVAGCEEKVVGTAASPRIANGTAFLVRVQPGEGREVNSDSLHLAKSILTKRMDPEGTAGVAVSIQDNSHLYVEVPGMTEAEAARAKGTIEKVARLQFRLLDPEGLLVIEAPDDNSIKPGYKKLRYLDDRESRPAGSAAVQPDKFIWVKNKAELGGKSVKSAVAFNQPGSTDYSISVTLDEDSGKKMMEISAANVGKPMALCLENAPGEFEVISAPTINGAFGAQFEITGRFTESAARTLASQLMNPLENPLIVEKTTVIPPSAPRTP